MSNSDYSPLALALGRMPSGLYIVTTSGSDGPLGFVGSFVAQVGLEPPTVCVAVGKDRTHLAAMRSSGRFALSILDGDSSGIMKPFFQKGGDPFAELETARTAAGSTVLSGALAWIDCSVTGEHEIGDHVVVFGVAEEGSLQREGDPKVHLRKNGLGY
ncbi:MAG: flavin reductase (DIM6/NTAB) family NADH-FMN oxidoreductase RutF [Chlamydiales bacterium]|jgi:flavin reductase (DIM6/NTAB) family NADH-FMN oxidoreductase RutF